MDIKDKSASKEFLTTLTKKPGIYRMLNEAGEILYVGKAKNLKNRVSSYFTSPGTQSPKTRALMANVFQIEVTVTRTEAEALVLENNLIKEYHPRYNVLLRDDKSYPYIHLSSDQAYPRLSFHRGARKGKGTYFGPFPNSGAVRRTLNLLQKLFQVRSCEDTVFKNRSRPCLQYQIKRCTAPCVGLVSKEDYRRDIDHAVMFLEGKNEEVIDALYEPMQQASKALEFERAAHYRDQISNLRKVQEHQLISNVKGEIDLIACASEAGHACIQIFYIRSGMNLGNKTFYPRHTRNTDEQEILSAFIAQYYLDQSIDRKVPAQIIVSHLPADAELLSSVLTDQAGRNITIKKQIRGEKFKWLQMALENAKLALRTRLSDQDHQSQRLESLCQVLKYPDNIERIECFDISHTQGNKTVASCVVYGINGLVKNDYRRFNIKDITPGDDYAAMEQVLTRRYTRVQKEEGLLPDLILIDGGKGQTNRARAVMKELQLDHIKIIGVSKGPDRRVGQEKLILADDRVTMQLPADSPALHLIQQIRDEAHRFAITGHRQRRAKQATKSPLEEIQGIGSKRRQQLIHHFGGIQGVTRAGVEDLSMVPGINKQLAQKIYDSLHES